MIDTCLIELNFNVLYGRVRVYCLEFITVLVCVKDASSPPL